MLSGALQRNGKHEARLSNIFCDRLSAEENSEILRFAQNDKRTLHLGGLMMRTAAPASDPCAPAVKSQRIQQTFRH